MSTITLGTECKESVEAESQESTVSRNESASSKRRNVKGDCDAVDSHLRAKDYLTESEMERFLHASKRGKFGVRDYAMLLVCFRHGLRVSELCGLRTADLDLDSGHLWIRRLKGSLSTQQPISADESRALRAWLRERSLLKHSHRPELFLSSQGPFTRQAINYLVAQTGERAGLGHCWPHQLRHSCGYALANRKVDFRVMQDTLGHVNPTHTSHYTRTSASRFEGIWD